MGKSRDRMASGARRCRFRGVPIERMGVWPFEVQAPCNALTCAVGHNTYAEARIV